MIALGVYLGVAVPGLVACAAWFWAIRNDSNGDGMAGFAPLVWGLIAATWPIGVPVAISLRIRRGYWL